MSNAKKAILLGTVAAVTSLIMGCSTRPLRNLFSPSDEFRVHPYRAVTLANGLHIYYVHDESLPRVGLRAVVRTGLRNEAAELNGVNSVVAELLDQGTRTRSTIQLADAFNTLGTEFTAHPGYESTALVASSLSTDANELVDLFADVLMNPQFSEKELARVKAQYLAAIKRRVDDPSSFASLKFDEFLYPDHPYGRASYGTIKTISDLRRADVLRHYLTYYRPNNTSLAVAGRFDSAFEKKLETVFGAWIARDVKPTELPALAPESKIAVQLVSRPHLEQAQIRVGTLAIARTDPDFQALALGVHALGGGFAARLMQKLRDDLGLTYSVSGGLYGHRSAGAVEISTFTKNETTGRTIEEILKLYDDFVKNGVTEAELNLAKADLLGEYPRGLELADDVGNEVMILEALGLQPSELTDYPRTIRDLNLKQVNEAIRRHLRPDSLKVLVYASEKAVLPQLKPWQPEVVRVP